MFLIDDLSAASPRRATGAGLTVLPRNFFPNRHSNPASLNNPTLGIPSGGWNRGGSSASIDQVSSNATSPTHSLALVDNDPNNYGNGSMFFNLSNLVGSHLVNVQWYQLYSVTNGNMRLSFAFLDSGGNTLFGIDYNTSSDGTNAGWNGSVATSTFEKQFRFSRFQSARRKCA